METPPIPPNCEDIFRMLDEWCFVSSSGWIPLRGLRDYKNQRGWILEAACRARCAWLDEAERLKQTAFTIIETHAHRSVQDGHRFLPSNHEQYPAYVTAIRANKEAHENAEKWKLWGEGK